ncbi:hypothetical protein Tco_0858050 [Tanacetum coccineum]|uniref:Uncharacterized protein n=1 Tax=Tanacetum coccineum TaxID=301880 RepID=A0ABQ5BB00_9ASTR
MPESYLCRRRSAAIRSAIDRAQATGSGSSTCRRTGESGGKSDRAVIGGAYGSGIDRGRVRWIGIVGRRDRRKRRIVFGVRIRAGRSDAGRSLDGTRRDGSARSDRSGGDRADRRYRIGSGDRNNSAASELRVVDRVQHETSLEGPILEDVEETIAREEVDLGISPPNTELDECEFVMKYVDI